MSSNFLEDSIFIVEGTDNNQTLKLITNNKEIKDVLKRDIIHSYYFCNRLVQFTELEISGESSWLVERIKTELGENCQALRIIPSRCMCSIFISVNELFTVSEIFHFVRSISTGLKKCLLVDSSSIPGKNQNICFLDYEDFKSAKNALKILNFTSSWGPDPLIQNLQKILCPNSKNESAFWCEPCVDMVKEQLSRSPFFFIENVNFSLHLNILKLKETLEQYAAVSSIRIYGQKLLVSFCSSVQLPNPLTFEGKSYTVTPAMKPVKNIEKYRERSAKMLPYYLSEEDREMLLTRFSDKSVILNELIRKKAENAALKIFSQQDRRNPKSFSKDRNFDGENKDYKRMIKSSDKVDSIFHSQSSQSRNPEKLTRIKRPNRSQSPSEDSGRFRNKNYSLPSSNNQPIQSSNSNPNIQLLATLGLLANINNNPSLMSMLQNLASSGNNHQNYQKSSNSFPNNHQINFTNQVNPSYSFQQFPQQQVSSIPNSNNNYQYIQPQGFNNSLDMNYYQNQGFEMNESNQNINSQQNNVYQPQSQGEDNFKKYYQNY